MKTLPVLCAPRTESSSVLARNAAVSADVAARGSLYAALEVSLDHALAVARGDAS